MSPEAAAPSRRARRRRPRLLTLGDLVLDIVVRPERGLTVGSDVGGTIDFRAGGSAANTARAFVALGGEATFIGAVGGDAFGRRLVRALRADGVRVHATAVSQPTARLAALIDPRGERSFVTQRGAADRLRRRDVRVPLVERSDAVHLPAYSLFNEPLRAAALSAIERGRAGGALISIDLASRRPLLAQGRAAARRLIGEAGPDVLFANTDEARALVGDDHRRLLELAPLAVIKQGAAGSDVLWRAVGEGGENDVVQLAVATAPLKVTDTTGAGDAFDAGFLHSVLEFALAQPSRAQPRSLAEASERGQAFRRAHVLRRAAVAGHRAAAALLSRPRPELVL